MRTSCFRLLPILAWIASGVFVSCGSVTESPEPRGASEIEPVSRERVDVGLASVLLPVGDWKVERVHPAHVRFGKLGDAPAESFVGMLALVRLPPLETREEFAALIRAQRDREGSNPRFETVLRDEGASTQGETFVYRFHVRMKDTESHHAPAGTDLLVEDYGAVFQHPWIDGVAVNAVLSRRSRPEDALPELEAMAEAFFASVEFLVPPAEPAAGP